MADVTPTADVFTSILHVLQRIEEKLDGQERRFNDIEKRSRGTKDSDETSELDLTEVAGLNGVPSPKPSMADSVVFPSNEKTEVAYSDVGFSAQEPGQNEAFKELLKTYLGDCWKLPDDKRLPLNLVNRAVDWTHASWDPKIILSQIWKDKVKIGLERLRRFDVDLRAQPGNDFFIIDYCPKSTSRLYRIGEKAVGSELKVSLGEPSHHQWSRLILYQGMTTGNSIKPRIRNPLHQEHEPIPYFSRNGASAGLWSHLSGHLELKRRDTTTNPYLNHLEGFHTTFYEIRKTSEVSELWKQGPLYDHPLGWSFRKSAYTLYSPPQTEMREAFAGPEHQSLVRHWTLLVLAPDHFFNENNLSFPIHSQAPQKTETLGHSFGRLHSIGAEMNLIAQGLGKISERWAEFHSFFDFTLDGSDSLMEPSEHDNLLFDDGAFSRSRRYFWAIDCLSEFHDRISDNIHQWELFKQARVLPLLAVDRLPDLDYRQYQQAEKHCRVLHVQRDNFRQKLASTKALRDALFNASAVIESRASTRLGENVKLLTFVNIFFLPLSFCTSVWSINDKFSDTALIITIILVAAMTYLAMFNVNSIVRIWDTLYGSRKKNVVSAMKADQDERWKRRGKRFEVFRPKHENPEPSDWYITLYTLMRPALFFGFGRSGALNTPQLGSMGGSYSTFSWTALTNMSRKRQRKPEEPGRPDEGWVL